MVAVSANSQSSQYIYDSLGHVVEVKAPLATDQAAIFSFMPTHGEAGTQVVIQGQAFDPVAVNDTVSFNGVVTAVSSASSSQISVTVPAGASSGPITVQTGSRTATSASSFIVDGTGLPPTISAISPQAVTAGGTITISGAHFEPVGSTPGTSIGGIPLHASSISDSQIQAPMSGKAVTGYVNVSTPYGWTKSPYPIVLLPAAVSAASVASVVSLTAASPSASTNIGSAGQYGLVTFDANAGAWMSLQLSGIVTTASSVTYSIYSPANVLLQQGTVSSASPSIHLPQLVAGGTYLAVFKPDTAGAQFAITSELDKTVSSSILSVATTTAGQSERLVVPAGLNQSITVDVATVSTNPSSQSISYSVMTPTGELLTSAVTSSTGQLPIPIPVAGNYQLIVSPGVGETGSSLVSLVNGVAVTVGEGSTSFSGYAAGKVANVTFAAHANDNLEVLVDNLRVSYNDRVTLNVLDGNGTNIASGACTGPTSECRLPAWNLAGGTYTLQVVPQGSDTVSFNASVIPDLVGPQLSASAPAAFTLNSGHVERLTFAANAGDSFSLQLSHLGTTPIGQPLQLAIYSPAGAILPGNALVANSFSSDGTLEISNAPVTGTYTVVVSTSGLPAQGQLALVPTLISGPGQSTPYGGYLGGQVADVTFNANAGDNLEVLIDGLQVSYNDRVSINVLDASGTNVASGTCQGTAAECRLPAWNLVGGTYTVKVVPPGNDAIGSVNVTILPDVTGPMLAANTASGVKLANGEVERLTFSARAGDNVGLRIAALATTPIGQPLQVAVYRPGLAIVPTGALVSNSYAGDGMLQLSNLPSTGVYTVIVSTSGLPATAQLTLVSTTAGDAGKSMTYGGYLGGETAAVTFTADAGDNREVLIDGLQVSYNDRVSISVVDAAGATVASGTCMGTTSECRLPAWNLAGGIYTVKVVPPGSDAISSFNLTIREDIAGRTLVADAPFGISLAAGDVERLAFTAKAGDNLGLVLSGLATTPTGQPLLLAVYGPGGTILPTNALISNSYTGAGILQLTNLPSTGTYTVVVSTTGMPAVGQLTLVSTTAGQGGQSTTYRGYLGGQVAAVNFSANPGDNLEILIDALQVSYNDRVTISVLDATGASIATGTCTGPTSECRLPAWNLAGGIYTIKVVPPGSDAISSFNVTIRPDMVGRTLAADAPLDISLAKGGVERLTFTANAGDNMGLVLSSLATSPVGQPVQMAVYAPGATILPTGALIGNSYTGAGILQLTNLPATGTYTVVVSTTGLPAVARLTRVSTTTGDTGQSTTYRGYLGGQTAAINFNAKAGDNLEVLIDALQVSYNDRVSISVLDAGGTTIANGTCTGPTAECRLPAWNLAGGVYTVKVVPSGSDVISSFDVTVQPDIVGPALAHGAPLPIALRKGQVERLTFTGSAGEPLFVNVAGLATTPYGQALQLAIYGPGGSILTTNASLTKSTSSEGDVLLGNMPKDGIYTMVVSTAGAPAVAQLTVASGTGSGTTTPPMAASPTQTFAASAGENLEVLVDHLQVTNNDAVTVNVIDPSGTTIGTSSCQGSTTECRLPVWNAVGGTYTVQVAKSSASDVLSHFSVTVQDDLIGTALTADTPSTVALNKGQVARLPIQINAGDNVALDLQGLVTTPEGQLIHVAVYSPTRGIVPTNALLENSYAGTGELQLSNVAATGTYTVVVSTTGVPATVQITPHWESVGTSGEAGTFGNYQAGQAAFVPFTAHAGDNLEVLVDHLQNTNNDPVTINLIDATGTNIGSRTCQGSTAECRVPLWNAQAEAYTVQIVPYQASDVLSNVSISVQPDIMGSDLAENTPSVLSIGNGQVERVNFTVGAGDNVVLDVSGLATAPGGQTVQLAVYSSLRDILTTNAVMTQGFVSDGQLQLGHFPVAGTYTLVVSTTGIPATLQVTPRRESVGTDGKAATFGNYQPGQSAFVPFVAKAGDNLEVLIDNLQNTNNDLVTINLIDPTGTNVGSRSCQGSTAECRVPLWNAQAGTYTVQVVPYQGSDVISNLSIMVQPDVLGAALAVNTPSTMTIDKGQVERVSFTVNPGDNVVFDVSGVTTTPGGQPVQLAVYNPSRDILANNAQMTQSFTGDGQLQVGNFTLAGTYTLIVSTTGVPATLQVTQRRESIATDGQTGTFGNYQAGHAAYVPFTASAGDNLEVLIDHLQNSNNDAVTINVIDPTGTNIGSSTCQGTTAECRLPVWNAQAGTYTIQVVPYQAADALSNVSVTVQPDLSGPAMTADAPSVLSLTKGQVERVTFTANAGDNVVFNVDGLATTPAGQAVLLAVYRPMRDILTTNAQISQSFTRSGQLQISNMPVSGTYTVVVSTTGLPGTARITPHWESVASNGQTATFGNYQAGEAAYVPFTANGGDNLEVLVDNLKITNNDPVTVNIVDPTGTNIASISCQGSTAECRVPAWNTQAGTYTVQVVPRSGSDVLSDFSVTVQPDVVGPALVAHTPETAILAKGQVERVTFSAKAGDDVTLAVAALTTSPPGQALQLAVYSPMRAVLTTNAIATGSVTSDGQLQLHRVPVSGTYTLVISTSGVPATALVAVTSSNGSGDGQPVTYPNHTFSANKGDNLEVLIDHLQVSYNDRVAINVVDTNGAILSSGTCQGTASECRFPAWNLAGGTYTVQVIPSGTDTATFTTTVQADVIGPELVDNSAATISMANGQVERLTFNAEAGSNLSFKLAGITTTPAGQPIQVAIYAPNKAIWPTGALVSNSFTGNGELELSNAPVTGTYTMVVTTSGLPVTAQVTMVPSTVETNDQTATYAGYVAGQVAQSTFTADPGDNLEVLVDKLQVSYNDRVTINVVDRNGTNLASSACTGPASECRLPVWNLIGGVYTIQIVPQGSDAVGSYNVTVQPDISGPLLADHVTSTATLANGQVERLTFTATAGENLSFSLAGIATTPSGQPIQVAIYGPNKAIWPTGALVSNSFTGSAELELSNAPVSGSYTMVISTSGVPATAQVTKASATVTNDGHSSTYAGYLGGQVAQSTFTANAGDNLEVLIDKLQVSYNDRVTINVIDKNGTNLASGTCMGTASECRLPVWNLVGGIYTVQIVPPGSDAIGSYNVTVQPDVIGSPLVDNVASTVALGNGQVERLPFTATAGANLSFDLAGITTTPAGQPVQVAVYGPDKAIWPTGSLIANSFTGSAELELSKAPATGTYTMVISTTGVPATAQVTMVSTMVAGNNQPTTATGYLGGQIAQSTFTAKAGDNLELLIDKLQVSYNDRVTINVIDKNGTNLATGTCMGPASECRLPIWNLAGGTYTVQIVPPGSDAISSFNATVQADISGPQLAENVASTVALGNGQVERLTFTATAGSNLSFELANITTTPTGQPVQVAIYGPNKVIWPTGAVITNSFTGNAELELSNAPATGVYTMVISTSGLPATAQVTMVPATVASNDDPSTYTGYLGGQIAQSTFIAKPGDNLEVLIDKLQVSYNDRVTVNVIDANGTNLATGTCTGAASECRLPAWNLIGGIYTIQIVPSGSDAISSYNATVQPDIVGPKLANAVASPATLGNGQVERLTFDAAAGANLSFAISGVNTTPTGQPVQVAIYGPDKAIWPTGYVVAKSFTADGVLELSNAPSSGTYTVLVSTTGMPAGVQVMMVPVVVDTSGDTATYTGYLGGQAAQATFTAHAGDDLEVLIDGLQVSYNDRVTITVMDPTGATVGTGTCQGATTECRIPAWNLTSGTYTVRIVPSGSDAINSYNITVQPDITGEPFSTEKPTDIALNPGQVGRTTFVVDQSAPLQFQLSGTSGGTVFADVYAPSSNPINPGGYLFHISSSGTNTVSLGSLGSGTYTVVVYTDGTKQKPRLSLFVAASS